MWQSGQVGHADWPVSEQGVCGNRAGEAGGPVSQREEAGRQAGRQTSLTATP